MQKSSFFNSVNGDRKYNASDIAAYFSSFISNGVYPNPATNLQVSAAAGMNISIAAGKAWINGYFYENTDALSLAIDVADGVLKRIDRVVLRLEHVNRQIILTIIKGVPTSNPVAPVLTRDADIYEIALADVLINNGDISVLQAQITDLRMDANLCGIVSGVVEQIDTTGLFAQYDAEFNDWFASLQGTLDGDTAGNLLNKINDLAGADRTTETVKGNADAITTHLAETATIDKNGHVKHGTYTTTLDTTWSGSTAPFTKTQTVAGILVTDTPIIDVVMSGTYATDDARQKAWSKIYRITTAANSITLYATVKPTVSLPIQLKVVR